LAALAKNSRERGWVHSGGGFGKMFRIAWYSAKQLGAQPAAPIAFGGQPEADKVARPDTARA